jgi:hypothetical protein
MLIPSKFGPKKICADQPILKNWDEILARSLPSVRLDWRIPYATKKTVNPKKGGGGSFFCLLSTIHWPLSWPLFSVRCYLVWKTAFISSFSRNRNCHNFFFFLRCHCRVTNLQLSRVTASERYISSFDWNQNLWAKN